MCTWGVKNYMEGPKMPKKIKMDKTIIQRLIICPVTLTKTWVCFKISFSGAKRPPATKIGCEKQEKTEKGFSPPI